MEVEARVLSPKKQEIRDRPGRILSVARKILLEDGYPGLTMDRIAKRMNCSRPPIYEHFTSREDVVIGLAIEDAQQRWKLNKHAVTFKGRCREKLVAINEFTFRTYTEHLKILSLLQPNGIKLKATKKHVETLNDYETRSFDVLTRVVDEAVKIGDLKIPGDQPPSVIAYALLCLTFGSCTFESRTPNIPFQQQTFDRHLATKLGSLALLDGLDFQPLTLDWDYARTVKKVREDLDLKAYIELTESEKPSRGF